MRMATGVHVGLRYLLGQQDRDPEATEHLAHRRAGAYLAEEVGFLLAEHGWSFRF